MTHSDFVWIPVDTYLHAQTPVVNKSFVIEGTPLERNAGDTGYLLIQVRGVQSRHHRILINGRDLPDFDVPTTAPSTINNADITWMDRVPPGFLRPGENRLSIRRAAEGDDNFFVYNLVVHWREQGFTPVP